ncbi:MAG TPA: hypothetical protein VF519_02075 [Mycobacteriales bacterium]
MKVAVARAAVAGAFLLPLAPLAGPASADCAPVTRVVCEVICAVPHPAVHRVCTVT